MTQIQGNRETKETDMHRQKQTGTDRIRQGQTGTDRNRQEQIGTERNKGMDRLRRTK